MGKIIRIYQDNKSGEYCSDETVCNRTGKLPTNLGYDTETKVIYYYFKGFGRCLEDEGSYMSPYISENGKFCRFIDNKIVEIN